VNNYVKQVGGDHYSAEYQHWDWVPETGLGYLEASATAYIARYMKKDGLKDLEKAMSFINKIIVSKYLKPAGTRRGIDSRLRHRYLTAANLIDTPEGDLTTAIDTWKDDDDLEKIVKLLEELISDYRS